MPPPKSSDQASAQVDHAHRLVKAITSLSTKLPESVPVAEDDDAIYTVMTSENRANVWETFNSRFDALFAEHLRVDGHFPAVRRGRRGMMSVCGYLNRIVGEDGLKPNIALVVLKLERLKIELEERWYAHTSGQLLPY